MTRKWTSVPLAVACVGAVTLAAQTGSQTAPGTQAPGTQTTMNRPAAAGAITVNGCLTASGAMTGGTTQGATAGSAPGGSTMRVDQWVLTNAATGAAATAGSGGSGAPGTTPEMQQAPRPATNMAASGSMGRYVLEGRADELAKHKGHRIEVVGTLTPVGTSGTVAPSGGAPGTTPEMQQAPRATTAGANAQASMDQRLQVTSIRMVSATCP
jgi:hypothetical protein